MSHPNPSHDSDNEYPADKVTHYPKAKALKKRTGFDGKKRWGNSGLKGHGVNSPAMMEARKKFNK